MTTTTNGQVRKSLASQIDRLDSILDGLSDNLNEAVASAVQGAVELVVRQAVGQAVKEAVQAVLVEIMTNADLLATLRTVLPTAPGSPPDNTTDPPESPKGFFRRAFDKVKAGLAVASTACTAVAGRVAGAKALAYSGWLLCKRFRGRLLVACGVGVVAGTLTYLAGPWLAVAASSAAGFVTTLAVQAANGLRKLFAPAAAFA